MPPPPPPPQPGYGYQAQPPTGPRPGELVDRFAARLIDGVLLAIVNALLVSLLVVRMIMGGSNGLFGTGGGIAAGAVGSVLSAAIYLGYFAFMESNQGQTVGKMVMKLRVVGPDGNNPTLKMAARRNIWMAFGVLGVVPFIGGFVGFIGGLVAVILIAVGINNDTVRRQGWHDHFGGETQVLKIG